MSLYENLRSIPEDEARRGFTEFLSRFSLGEEEGLAVAKTFEDFPALTSIANGIENFYIHKGFDEAVANRAAKGALIGFAILKEIAENQIIPEAD